MADRSDSDEQQRRMHRALANVNRLRLVKLLEEGPRDISSLTQATGLHPNTVRAHLDVLTDGGVVDRVQRPSSGRGRPAWVYALPAPPVERQLGDRRLTEALIDALRQVTEDPATAAEAAGRTWGGEAVAGDPPASQAQIVERLAQLLEEQGFAPVVHHDPGGGARVALHACPFADLARQHGEIICSVHLGLLRGVLEELGTPVQAELHPFVQSDLCMVELRGSQP